MAALHPAAEWLALQDTFYRLHRLYQMQWAELDLTKFRIAAASFGGPIALLRDERQLVEAGTAPLLDTSIHVYTASGQAVGRIECEGAHVAGFGWNSREELVCVQEDGNVRVFSLSGREPAAFSLGAEARECGVVDCRFWDQGLVAMTADCRFVCVADVAEPKPRMLADPRLDARPHSWTVVAPHLTLSRHVEVLAAVGATVVSIDAAGVQDQLLEHGPYASISVSPNGRLAALCSGGRIQVVSTDFQRSLSEHVRPAADAPLGIAWCGSDAVVASYADEALLVGPFGDVLALPHDAPVHLVQELDGVRMFNGSVHESLARVGDDALSVFQIGSTSPAALLYDATDSMRDHASHADEIVRSIRSDMPQAVDTCIAAAGAEPAVELQQQLLRAASLGKAFLPAFNGDKLADMCRSLRVINALAAYAVGIPVSLTQFQSLPLEEWVARLLNRNLHRLALHVCRYMAAPSAQVYVHWACAKIRASTTLDDDALYRLLRDRLRAEVPSYVDIAEVANRCGYRRLAIRLLHHEPRAASQVPLLLSMGQDAAAMHAAVRSGDADLVYFVIFHLFKALPLGDFFLAIGRTPVAGRLFERYCTQVGAPVLEDYYFQNDSFARSAHLVIAEALAERDPARIVASLKAALKMLHRDKTRALEAAALDQQVRLVQVQQQLGAECAGATLNETLARCLADGDYARANKLRSEFRVPERRFAWIRLRALVARRDWPELARMANARKSPIGYRPFADECIAALQFQEAAKYIPRCDPHDHAPLFLRIGFYREAADAAAKARDLDMLRQVHAAVRDLALQHHIAQMIEQLARQ
ncbi:Vacuolar protein [Coemansia javaensis]|uniref:Probable vacuolar protein sorting-associated protein 16 homolog n=1 Tax=Coemansia javaensis TaxID=2761396 RepID=A0A9W8HAY6_9FUNG|nr:Vacuolar protein [Coemansia javaensis]